MARGLPRDVAPRPTWVDGLELRRRAKAEPFPGIRTTTAPYTAPSRWLVPKGDAMPQAKSQVAIDADAEPGGNARALSRPPLGIIQVRLDESSTDPD